MAAVSFYRFAAAVMELLEPEKYNFTRKTGLEPGAAASDESDSMVSEVLSSAATEITTESALKPLSFSAAGATAAESQTVAAVAEHLSNAIANASEDKLNQVAAAIKEAAAETKAVSPGSADGQASAGKVLSPAQTITETALLVQTTVATLASQTTKEIVQNELVQINDSATGEQNAVVKALNTIEAKAAEVVTTAITDKIKQKTDSSPNSTSNIAENTQSDIALPVDAQTKSPEIVKPFDFWELFPELDVFDSKYYEEIVDMYSFMQSGTGTLLDILNPENDINLRYGLMTSVSEKVGEANRWEAEANSNLSESRQDTADKTRKEAKEAREANKLRQLAADKWQQQQRQKLAERMTAERLKEAL